MTVLLEKALDVGRDLETSNQGASPARLTADGDEAVFRREGHFWTIGRRGRAPLIRLKDLKGLRFLACLLRDPGAELHVLQLLTLAEATNGETETAGTRRKISTTALATTDLGDAGEILDARAKTAYRERLSDLREELEEAQSHNDTGRVERLSAEIEALTRELARAVGLGGRDRRAASAAERGRVAVTKAIRTAIAAIAREDPALGRHFDQAIRTGRVFSYRPDAADVIDWRL